MRVRCSRREGSPLNRRRTALSSLPGRRGRSHGLSRTPLTSPSRRTALLLPLLPPREERAGERRAILFAIAFRSPCFNFHRMNPTNNARRLRRQQTREEQQLWRALKAGRFAGFKFRRQHPLGEYFLDFYCPSARLSIELDGFQHGLPRQRQCDTARKEFLASEGIEELRFWNHQWRKNRAGILLEIWQALHRRTGCVQVLRKVANNRFVPPAPSRFTAKPERPPMWQP